MTVANNQAISTDSGSITMQLDKLITLSQECVEASNIEDQLATLKKAQALSEGAEALQNTMSKTPTSDSSSTTIEENDVLGAYCSYMLNLQSFLAALTSKIPEWNASNASEPIRNTRSSLSCLELAAELPSTIIPKSYPGIEAELRMQFDAFRTALVSAREACIV